ncbi:Uncharacterized protein FWK35_00033851, partial [Aphis craccivora]
TVYQLIRTTSNLRFEIRELAKKMDTTDQRLNDTIVNTSSAVHENNDLFDKSSWDLPLTTIENLELFEEKLSDKLFRKKVSLFGTVRRIRKYNCCPDIDISKPLKIYMANAKAREENKQRKNKDLISNLKNLSNMTLIDDDFEAYNIQLNAMNMEIFNNMNIVNEGRRVLIQEDPFVVLKICLLPIVRN